MTNRPLWRFYLEVLVIALAWSVLPMLFGAPMCWVVFVSALLGVGWGLFIDIYRGRGSQPPPLFRRSK